MEIVSAAVGALFHRGGFQLPNAGASGVLSCFGCFTLRYCHVSTSQFILLHCHRLFNLFEKVRKSRKTRINFFLLAAAFALVPILAAFGAETLAVLLAQKAHGQIGI